MPRARLTIDARLTSARIAIDNALLDATVRTALARYGYDTAKIQHGKQLYQLAADLRRHQRTGYGSQAGATDTLAELHRTARTAYMRLVKLARVAFKDQRNHQVSLDLLTVRKQTLGDWIAQAEQFYRNALDIPDITRKLAAFGVDTTALRSGMDQLEKVKAAQLAQANQRGAAQQATKDRNRALQALDEWFSDFVKVARIALAEQPDQLEKLGIAQVRAAKPAAPRAAA